MINVNNNIVLCLIKHSHHDLSMGLHESYLQNIMHVWDYFAQFSSFRPFLPCQ